MAAGLRGQGRALSYWAVPSALLCAGIAAGQLSNYSFPRDHVALFTAEDPRLACVELQFAQTPRLIENPGPRHGNGKQVGVATVVAIKTWNGWEPASGELTLSFGQPEPRLAAGQRVRVIGMIERPAPAMNPGQFDWEQYYRRQRVLSSLHVSHACDLQVLSAGGQPVLNGAREGIREWLAKGFDSSQTVDRALLQALVLGDRAPEMRPVEEDFQKTGTSHLLSSSGLRVSILAAFVFLFCRLLCLRPRKTVVVVGSMVLLWGVLTMPSPQAIRPVVVTLAVGLGLVGRRSVDAAHILAVTAIALLIVNPLDLYGAGFQLSFVIVLGMLVLTGPFIQFLGGFRNMDDEVLEQLRRLTPWQRARRAVIRGIGRALAAGLVAWVVSLPLVAYHFGQFTPWAVPVGLLLSPLVFAALALGFLKVILTMLIPGWAAGWAAMAGVPVALLRWGIGQAARLPGADIPTAAPAIWQIALFYALLCLPLLPFAKPLLQRCVRCAPVGAVALMLTLTPMLMGVAGKVAGSGSLRVTLLSVGAGQCAVVERPGGKTMLLDDGSMTITDPLQTCLAPFLRFERQQSIDAIYLSHCDYDHTSAAAGTWPAYGVREVVVSSLFRRSVGDSVTCKKLLRMLDASGHPPREIAAGDVQTFGDGMSVEVLWPPRECVMNSNNSGVVLRLVFGGRSILFPADIQDAAMRELLKHPEKLKSDVLVAAHHGSSEPLTAAFIRAVDPAVIVSSNADHLTKKQRDFEQLIEHRPLYRTGRSGAITIELDSKGEISVAPFLKRKQAGMTIPKEDRSK
ncbi:MAG: putative hydrolase [Phycisphaerales bacterium]|nr:putative hydrolase [Phycisphaerales bacterium]